MPLLLPVNALAGSSVEFDVAPTAECRDVTPLERITQYPNQRLIEVSLPISVRFHGVSMDEVDELAIDVNGAHPACESTISPRPRNCSATSRTKSKRQPPPKRHARFDGSLAARSRFPAPMRVAHLTPTISAD